MQDTFDKIKNAIDFNTAMYSTVTVENGIMYGSNGHLLAAAPCDLPDFTVGATALQKFLAVVPDPDIKLTDKTLILSKGSAKARLPLVVRKYTMPEPWVTQSVPLKDEFVPMLRQLQPFISESHVHMWRCGIACYQGKAYATDGAIVIERDFDLGTDALLNFRLVKYVISRAEKPVWFHPGPTFSVVMFEDGSWVRCQRLADEKVETMSGAFTRFYKHPEKPVNPDMRKAFYDAQTAAAEVVTITKDGVLAEVAGSDIALDSQNDTEAVTHWTVSVLGNLFANATHFDINEAPGAASSFRGDGLRGIILKREKACDRKQD